MGTRLAVLTLLAVTAASGQVGALRDGRYRHTATGIEFTLPPGWAVVKATPSSSEGDIVVLTDSVSRREAAVWMRAEKHPSAQVQKLLLAALDAKAAARTGLADYKIRTDSIQPRVIAGTQALSAIADYTRNGLAMVECLTWVFSPNAHALFYGRAPAASLDAFRARLDAIVNSARVP